MHIFRFPQLIVPLFSCIPFQKFGRMYKNASQVNPLAFKFSLFLSVMIYEENGNQKKAKTMLRKSSINKWILHQTYTRAHTNTHTLTETRVASPDTHHVMRHWSLVNNSLHTVNKELFRTFSSACDQENKPANSLGFSLNTKSKSKWLASWNKNPSDMLELILMHIQMVRFTIRKEG